MRLCFILLISFFSFSPPDDGTEPSSGRDTPVSSSSRQGVGDQAEEKGKKEKKKKAKTKKKEKSKVKGKEKEKKKTEEPEETEKKSKKIGFGLLRWGILKRVLALASLYCVFVIKYKLWAEMHHSRLKIQFKQTL